MSLGPAVKVSFLLGTDDGILDVERLGTSLGIPLETSDCIELSILEGDILDTNDGLLEG